ncbi:unnamed protein product, partial [Anisakis simplex]|uniref:Transposase n=1 Tax=Anisakis simplex TaxID=6269 RepID=A0A0M3JJB2_ANISI
MGRVTSRNVDGLPLKSNDKLTDAALLTPMLRRIQFKKTTKFVKQFVLFLSRFAIIKGGNALYQALESIQS